MKHNITDNNWLNIISSFFDSEVGLNLFNFLEKERRMFEVYPSEEDVFNACSLTPFDDVKVVLLGQDPYHGVGQAHGLSFSIKGEQKLPPSLKNIFKEQAEDLSIPHNTNGNLENWARQGVLLLNTVLTVRAGEANSHQKKGWEILTDTMIKTLSEQKENLVYLLWGKNAQSKISLIDSEKHLILTAPHPSPLSAHSGFFGCKHFSKCNAYLKEKSIAPINWRT